MPSLRPSRGIRTPKVRVGEWVRVPVPGDPFPVHMQIGPTVAAPAFIDRERAADGYGVITVAAVRCPQLVPGRYDVIVLLPRGERINTGITVVE